ncbi:MAG: hypothetical protein ACPGUU_03030 [Flavobacteriaceae bacterium]
MKIKVFLIFLLVSNIFSYAQDKKYFDINNNVITKRLFKKKVLTKLYTVKENTTSYILAPKYYFKKKSSLYKSFFKAYLNENIEQPSILIRYQKELSSLKELPACVDDVKNYHKASKQWNKRNKKFVKKLERKNNLKVFYLHNQFNDEEKFKFDKSSIKDKNNLIGNFITSLEPNLTSGFLLIRSNGDLFFSKEMIFGINDLNKLLKTKNWNDFKNDLKKSQSLGVNYGFFNFSNLYSIRGKLIF